MLLALEIDPMPLVRQTQREGIADIPTRADTDVVGESSNERAF